MKVNGRKRRHESSSDEENETVKENKRLTERVKELETSLATAGNVKKRLEESLAIKTEENVKVGEDKDLLEEDRRQLKEERGRFEEEKKTVEEMKTNMEDGRVILEQRHRMLEEERVRVEEERVKVEKVSKEQQKLVECPVCLALPREDRAVPCCPQGHFVCSPCMDQLIR